MLGMMWSSYVVLVPLLTGGAILKNVYLQALVYRDMSINWADQNIKIKKLASSLYKAGVRKGERLEDEPSLRVADTPWPSIFQHLTAGHATHFLSIVSGDTVSVMALNIPALFDAHFAVPGIRAVINTLNTRCLTI